MRKINIKKYINSFLIGFGKSLDATDDLRIMKKKEKATLFRAWQNVNKELLNVTQFYKTKYING